ncbi:hypothetical protein CSV60_05930 [Sporosarcina sp. P7]|nr:hypothetical protein CSV60_05930 [Sporosarcina sp. P7]
MLGGVLLFVTTRKYKKIVNELLECSSAKEQIKKDLSETINVSGTHNDISIRIEELLKKESELNDSILTKEKLSKDLTDQIESSNKEISTLNGELRTTNKILNESQFKLRKYHLMHLQQQLKVRGYQLELKNIHNYVVNQSNEIHSTIKKHEIKLSNRLEKEIKKKKTQLLKIESDIQKADTVIRQKGELLEEVSELKKNVILLSEEHMLQEVSFYKNVYPFTTTEQFKEELHHNNEKQKEMIRNKSAIHSTITWTVNGSEREGRKMTNSNIRFMIRSFNIDCDNAISTMRHSNISTVEKRIEKSFNDINRLNKKNSLSIVDEYLSLKIDEMQLVYERFKMEQEQKELLRDLKEEERERKKVEKEIRGKFTELREREKELEKQWKILNKEYLKSDCLDDDLLHQIKEVESNMELVEIKREELNERLEVGRSGHVYIISNVGTLGEGIYKIGMTKRLEPLERIKELSAASVPFIYDVHAMILTDDAPALENHLHKVFRDYRVNMVNNRKEFFEVSLDQIKQEVYAKVGKNFIFEDRPMATQYYETLAIKNALEIANNSFYSEAAFY